MAEDKRTDDRPLSIEIDDSEVAKRGLLDQQEQQPSSPMAQPAGLTNNPVVAILSYCGSSILMTTTNKYVMSGVDFNLSFFLLCIQVRRCRCVPVGEDIANAAQSTVCVVAIEVSKRMGYITYRDFNIDEAKKCALKAASP